MDKKKKEVTSLVICIGTGGVFYHGLTLLSNFLKRREDCGIILIDGDTVEEKNSVRQWGFGVGDPKVVCADKVLSLLTGTELMGNGYNRMLEKPEDLSEMVLETCSELGLHSDVDVRVQRIFVFHAPDNHLCRTRTHIGCMNLSKIANKEVIEITAGNTSSDGYAFGCRHDPTSEIKGDFLIRHPDIQLSSDNELRRIERPLECGSLPVEDTSQTMMSNILTSTCLFSLAEEMSTKDDYVGEHVWNMDKEGRVVMRAIPGKSEPRKIEKEIAALEEECQNEPTKEDTDV